MTMTAEQRSARRRSARAEARAEVHRRAQIQEQMDRDSWAEARGLLTPLEYDARDHLLVAYFWGHDGDLARSLAAHEPVDAR